MHMRLIALAACAVLLGACGSKTDDVVDESAVNPDSSLNQSELAGPTPGTQEDLEVNVGDRVFFAFDSSTLSPQAQETLRRQAAWLNQYGDLNVIVEGHADERGTREYNLALGARRAEAARSFLTASGVAANRVTTVSYGEERPANPGSNEQAWAENRRAVTVLNVTN